MRYKLFGHSGLRVSEVCLGTMTFGEDVTWGASKQECQRMFDAYVEAGGNFVDTAINYTRGTSEKFVGEFIASNRDRLVVGTKYTMNNHNGNPNVAGSHRKNMVSRDYRFVSTGVIQKGDNIWAVQIFFGTPRKKGLFQ